MKFKFTYFAFILTLISISPGFADTNQNLYNMALSFEKAGEYAKAESLYVDLFNNNPENYNYYSRYRSNLLIQREYSKFLPVLESRIAKRQFDKYLNLELGVLYFALGDQRKSEGIWSNVFKGQNESIKNSYATAIYQDALEYGLGVEFYKITDMLRSITNDPRLLANYNFANTLRYREWDQAVEEIMHILNTDVRDLVFVRRYLFKYEPSSTLYEQIISTLEDTDSFHGIVLLSEIYIHMIEFDKAFEILSNNLDNDYVRRTMTEFANRMFKQGEYVLATKAAKAVESHPGVDDATKHAMAFLSARSNEMHFYEITDTPDLVAYPYSSQFLDIDFKPFDPISGALIRSAYAVYDSLSRENSPYGELSAIRHANITYSIYQDFDAAMNEYMSLAMKKKLMDKSGLITMLSKLMLAKGEYSRAIDLLSTAPAEFGLMVHEEDQLMAQVFYASVISGEKDSLLERTNRVLALFPKDDPLYNDLLAYSAIVGKVMKDSLNYDEWLKAERYLLMNNTASAMDIFQNLMDQKTDAIDIYGLRYLDCLNARKDLDAERVFWEKYYADILKSELGDYFILMYAEYMEKMKKFDISYEIFEKYLLSYQESMYYENIRQYVREHYSLGAP